MRFIDAYRVHQALNYPDLTQELNDYHRYGTKIMDDLMLAQPQHKHAPNRLLIWAAWQFDQAVGGA